MQNEKPNDNNPYRKTCIQVYTVRGPLEFLWAEGACAQCRSENKHRYEDTDKGIWPLDFLAEGPDCLSKFRRKRGGGHIGP